MELFPFSFNVFVLEICESKFVDIFKAAVGILKSVCNSHLGVWNSLTTFNYFSKLNILLPNNLLPITLKLNNKIKKNTEYYKLKDKRTTFNIAYIIYLKYYDHISFSRENITKLFLNKVCKRLYKR